MANLDPALISSEMSTIKQQMRELYPVLKEAEKKFKELSTTYYQLSNKWSELDYKLALQTKVSTKKTLAKPKSKLQNKKVDDLTNSEVLAMIQILNQKLKKQGELTCNRS